MLVLTSSYVDAIWKGVEIAKEDRYKIDGISTFATTTPGSGTINVLVAMSKGWD